MGATTKATIYGNGHLHSWTLTQGDTTGDQIENPGAPDRTVSVEGTFDSGTVVIQGSNTGSAWHTLHDFHGSELLFTGAGIATIAENPRFVRPTVTGAGATAALTVALLSRRS